eukprot:scaffold18100_cov149-Isochrysis_galbana.AAC.1
MAATRGNRVRFHGENAQGNDRTREARLALVVGAASTCSTCLAARSARALLCHSYASNQIVEVNTRRLESVLLGKNVNYTKIDGAAPASKDLRSAMWEASGVRGYPQLFIDGKVIGGGTFDELQELSARCPPLHVTDPDHAAMS